MSQAASSTDDDIRERAYHLWLQAGSPEGREEEFWHQAVEEAKSSSIDGRENNADGAIDKAGEDSFPASDPVNHA